ncbi:MAG: hypothetical protein HW380_3895 [Magnetococcales bacterium]|nr:hypothetical protein [Magnetococcales bacterium]
MHQLRVKVPQCGGIPEHEVRRPFALECGPVVINRKGGKHLLVERIQGTGNPTQKVWPGSAQLLVHQALRLHGIGDPWKAVVASLIGQADGVHLPSQPFPTVDANLDVERKPRLDPGIHESENGVELVLIKSFDFIVLTAYVDAGSVSVRMQKTWLPENVWLLT